MNIFVSSNATNTKNHSWLLSQHQYHLILYTGNGTISHGNQYTEGTRNEYISLDEQLLLVNMATARVLRCVSNRDLSYYLQRSRRCDVSFNLFICQPSFHECWSTVIEESSMQIFCVITGLHPRMPVRRHLIGVEWLKTPTHEEDTREGAVRTFMSRTNVWLLGTTRGDISSSASWSPVVVTTWSRLLPDFFLGRPWRCLCNKSQLGGVRDGPSRSCIMFGSALVLRFPKTGLSLGSGGEKSDLNLSGNATTVPFRNWTIRNSTCLSDSPDGAEKSGWNFSIKLTVSGVKTSDRWHPSQWPWLISTSASDDCICSSEKFNSCTVQFNNNVSAVRVQL